MTSASNETGSEIPGDIHTKGRNTNEHEERIERPVRGSRSPERKAAGADRGRACTGHRGVISPDSLINIGNEENYELNLFELPGEMTPENNQVNVIIESLSRDRDYPIPPIPFSD